MTTEQLQEDKGTVEADSQASAAFAAGFDTPTPAAPAAEAKPGDEPATKSQSTEAAPATGEQKGDEAPAAPPKYIQITQEQFDALQAAAGKTTAIESRLSKVFGTLGDVQQIVKTLQSQTPAGEAIEIPDDTFAELAEDYPDVAALITKGLKKALKGAKGTAPKATPEATPAAEQKPVAQDPEAVTQLVNKATLQREIEALTDEYEDWQKIIGLNDDGSHDPNNDFRKWLAAQTEAYQRRVNTTYSAAVISRAIGRFKEYQAKQSPKTPAKNPREEIIKDAVQPKGIGGLPPPSTSVEDAFRAGFEG